MKKLILVGISLCAVVLLVLGSLSNVVGYQSVQSSNQQAIKEEVNQRELLFQTIVDIANNKEIQRIILKSQMGRGIFPVSDIPILTKGQLKVMFLVGLMLSNVISKSRMQSMIGEYQFSSQEMQKGLSAAIEKDATLNGEMTQLSNSQCDCENRNTTRWSFPVLCSIFPSMNFLGIILLNILYLGIILKIIFTVIAVIIYILMMVFHYLLSFLP
ncbi:MAG TPA: hypothetical protein VN377_05550 [Candidatus Thermoplasmatota archaeon]|nr:hypothetical protein [Candidatus Thermoplasmatota archaeon]